jgi:hypothetical protein
MEHHVGMMLVAVTAALLVNMIRFLPEIIPKMV